MAKDRADELTPDYVEQDGKKVIEDEEVRELDEVLFQNKILSKVFSGITIKGKSITVESIESNFLQQRYYCQEALYTKETKQVFG